MELYPDTPNHTNTNMQPRRDSQMPSYDPFTVSTADGGGHNNNDPQYSTIPEPVKAKKWFFTAAGNPNQAYDLLHPDRAITGAGNVPEAFRSAKVKFFDYNLHAVKKTVSSALLDVALLMANASQLKALLQQKHHNEFYIPMLVMISVSIVMQIIIGVGLIVLSKININEPHDARQQFADGLNTTVVLAIFVLVVVNIFIASFGISYDNAIVPYHPRSPNQSTGNNGNSAG